MPAIRKPIASDKLAQARHLYENTPVPLDHIAALLGISRRTLSARLSEWGWNKRKPYARAGAEDSAGQRLAAAHFSGAQSSAPSPAPQDRIALAARIQAAAEREIAAVEQILAALGASDPAETEAAARTLASLARTLRELVHLDVLPPAREAEENEPPRDLDQLRRALARRLDELVAEAKAMPAGEGERH